MHSEPLIICFGASLTAGFQSPAKDNPSGGATPYGQFLQSFLGDAGRVRISGICGELTGDMVLRFTRDVLAHRPSYVPILGGTNDLGWNTSLSDIIRNLATMYEQVRAMGSLPIPVTVPSIRVEDDSGGTVGREWIAEHLARRIRLNKLIQDYADSNGLAYVDLFAATRDPISGQLAEQYSNDGIHLTTAGYQLFAEQVAHILLLLLVFDTPS